MRPDLVQNTWPNLVNPLDNGLYGTDIDTMCYEDAWAFSDLHWPNNFHFDSSAALDLGSSMVDLETPGASVDSDWHSMLGYSYSASQGTSPSLHTSSSVDINHNSAIPIVHQNRGPAELSHHSWVGTELGSSPDTYASLDSCSSSRTVAKTLVVVPRYSRYTANSEARHRARGYRESHTYPTYRRMFSHDKGLKKTIQSKHSRLADHNVTSVASSISSKDQELEDKRLICTVNGCTRSQSFATQRELNRHIAGVHQTINQGFRCAAPRCAKRDKLWARIDNYREHVRRHHPDENVTTLIER